MRRKLAAGNWKMHGSVESLSELDKMAQAALGKIDRVICPPALYIAAAAIQCRDNELLIGAQDCHAADFGAHTGDISAKMLSEAGASYVILGHSERRAAYREACASVRNKALAAEAAGLTPIICVGETEAERQSGEALHVIMRQIQDSLPDTASEDYVVAYEPIWAIGTGLTATVEDIAEIHSAMRASLAARFGEAKANKMRLLYGGSVKPANAAEIFDTADVDGALVGGASLKADDFNSIAQQLAESA